MEKQEIKKTSSPAAGKAIAIVGIVLIIAGIAYALYKRYVIGHTTLTRLATNVYVDALGIVGVILLVVGIALYYRMRTPKTPPPTRSGTAQGSSVGGQK
jgi:uncharacterized membrane protein